MTYKRPVQRAWQAAFPGSRLSPTWQFEAGFNQGLRLAAQRAAEMFPKLAEMVANGGSSDMVAYAVESGNEPEPMEGT